MKNQDRLTIRLDADMRAKLHERAGALGLDDAAFARMVLYGALNEILPPVAGQWPGRQMPPLMTEAKIGISAPMAEDDLADEPRAEDFEMPPDADGGIPLDDLLGAGPSILDEMMAAAPAPQPVARPAAPTYRSALPQRAARQQARPQVWGAFGNAYSMTRPVGVNGTAIGENAMGDGRGNVQRANMGHFVRAR